MADPTTFLNGRVTLWAGDCLAVLPTLDENSVDSVVCDPPYHLTSIVKRFGKAGAAEAQFGTNGAYRRASAGFMGKAWDGGDVAFDPATWAAVLRVMKPGAHLVAFGGTRTYHRLASAVEDAGFEIRDAIMWHYGSGFPKSHNVAVALDKFSGIGPRSKAFNMKGRGSREDELDANGREFLPPYEPSTEDAAQWQGWGTALKPATEILVLARKPLCGTVAENVLKHGVGAINIDGCRVSGEGYSSGGRNEGIGVRQTPGEKHERNNGSFGRWPANVIHDGSEEVQSAFPETGSSPPVGSMCGSFRGDSQFRDGAGGGFKDVQRPNGFGDSGSAARFFYQVKPDASRLFYSSKADSQDRAGSRHPTVKPLDLIQYLCRLITPPGGTILDCFAGSGTTAEAAWREGFSAILIEREAEYIQDIERRMALCLAGPDERARESIKARLKGKPEDHGPLFSSSLFDEAAE